MAKIDESGAQAMQAWCRQGSELPRAQVLTAVRFSLAELARTLPGRSVEVRVPPAGAVQILGGTAHRRGTPPAVIELDMQTWLQLAVGDLTWGDAEEAGLIDASGLRADLSAHLPLFPGSFTGRSATGRSATGQSDVTQ